MIFPHINFAMRSFVLIGSVDNGKSSLAGHLLFKQGVFSERDVECAQRDSQEIKKMSKWKWAFLLDMEEERAKGKTHDFSCYEFDYKDEKYTLIDTPGHKHFIRAMIQGIAHFSNPIGVIVVSAIENEFLSAFERGTLKEQCVLCRASGVSHIVVAINKMDAIDWDQKKFQNIRECLEKYLKKLQFLYVEFSQLSATTGKGLNDLMLSIDNVCQKQISTAVNNVNLNTEQIHFIPQANKFYVKIQILQCNSIFSAGFCCIAHIINSEFEVSVTEITKPQNKLFLKSGEKGICLLEFEQSQDFYTNDRIIFRKNDYTIGFGKFCLTKPSI